MIWAKVPSSFNINMFEPSPHMALGHPPPYPRLIAILSEFTSAAAAASPVARAGRVIEDECEPRHVLQLSKRRQRSFDRHFCKEENRVPHGTVTHARENVCRSKTHPSVSA